MSIIARRVFMTTALALCACASPQVGTPCADVASCAVSLPELTFDSSRQRDVDILFLIDNSPSMSPKQAALARNIPRFIQKIDEIGASYHVGIATSDVGTYVAPGQPWSVSLGACNSFEGDDGALQRLACTGRGGVSAGAASACASLCPDPGFVPQAGQGYIARVDGVTNVPKAMIMGVDAGPQRAFQCMALVGDAGCGVEGQLEGARRALDGHNPLNNGFLRPGSVLAVIFITDEDDCSVALGRRAENDPATMDCAAPSKDAAASCFNPDYRCLARDVVCNEPLNAPGEKTGCRERDDSYLEKVETYVRFFSALRPASRLLISGVWTLPRLDGGGRLIVRSPGGATRSDGLNRAAGAEAGCVNAMDGEIIGRPQLRLSKFAERFADSIELSVCDVDSYPMALDSIAAAIGRRVGVTCLPEVPRARDGAPICVVGDVDAGRPHDAPDQPLPPCGAGCCSAWATAPTPTIDDPGVQAACAGEPAQACYCALPSEAGACSGGAVFGLWRKGGADGPPDKVVNVRCAAP